MKTSPRGYITLLSLIIISTITVATTLSLISIGIDSSRLGLVVQQAAQAKWLAEGCAEEGLMTLRNNSEFTGNKTLDLEGGKCHLFIHSLSEENRTIQITSEVNNVFYHLEVDIKLTPSQFIIQKWEPVGDFKKS